MRKKAPNVFVSSASAKLGQQERGEQSFPRDDRGVKGDWERKEGGERGGESPEKEGLP